MIVCLEIRSIMVKMKEVVRVLQLSWCISNVPFEAKCKFSPCRVGFDHALWMVHVWKLVVYWKTGNCHNM